MAMGAMMESKAKRSYNCRRGEEEEGDQETAMEDLHVPLLPHHLVVRILGMLPIPCIAKARLVCRSWNSLLSSPAFLSTLQEATEWWLVMASPSWAAPDFVSFRRPARPGRGGPDWASFRLPAALPDLASRIAFSQSIVPSVVNMLAASSGGLICAVIKGGLPEPATSSAAATSPHLVGKLEYDVAVFNPLTGARALLPRPSRLSNKLVSSCSIAMSASSTSSSPATYSVILSDPKLRDLEIYDSQAATWRRGLGINASPHVTAGATFEDLLEGALLRYHREELASYSLASDSWSKAPVALPRGGPAELLSCTVIKPGGRILLVACLMEQCVSMKGFGIWELQPLSSPSGAHHQDPGLFTWVQVAQTPPHILDALGTTQFLSPSFYDPRFTGHGDFLCMTGAHYTIGTSSQPQYWPPLIYDLALDQWHLLPPHKHSRDLLCAFPFVPSFSTLV